jgi:NADPH:quinone reductase
MPRAVRFDEYGGIDVLRIEDVPIAAPQAGEVVVEVRAAGINPGEAAIRQGFLHDRFPATFPSGQGTDFAGVVSQTVAGIDGFAVGDEVLGWSHGRSSQAEFVTVPVDQIIRKPAAMSWEVAGGFSVVATTAYAAVRAVGAGAGDTVVVSAAAGGVGVVAVQLLKVRGANVVGIASEANHDWLASKGVTPVAYGEDLAGRVAAAAPNGVDAFIDLFGPDYVHLAIELGVAPDRIDSIIAFEAAAQVGAKVEGSANATSTEVLREMADLVAEGKIEVPIAATYPLDQVQEAFRALEQRHTRGKIVLIP